MHVLADQEDVDSAEVELVKIRQCSKTVISRVHSSIELNHGQCVPLVGRTIARHTMTVLPLYCSI